MGRRCKVAALVLDKKNLIDQAFYPKNQSIVLEFPERNSNDENGDLQQPTGMLKFQHKIN